MQKLVTLALLAATALTAPLYKQCDSRWGSNPLGNGGGKTICQAGCLVSSVAMAIGSQTPGSLNDWLKGHGGFASGNLFVWTAVSAFGLRYEGQISNHAQIASAVNSGKVVILNVHNGGHWVLATGHSGSTYSVNDPGFNTGSYTEGQVVRAGIFHRGAAVENEIDDEFMGEIESFPDMVFDFDEKLMGSE